MSIQRVFGGVASAGAQDRVPRRAGDAAAAMGWRGRKMSPMPWRVDEVPIPNR
jgi:hypothetical protein